MRIRNPARRGPGRAGNRSGVRIQLGASRFRGFMIRAFPLTRKPSSPCQTRLEMWIPRMKRGMTSGYRTQTRPSCPGSSGASRIFTTEARRHGGREERFRSRCASLSHRLCGSRIASADGRPTPSESRLRPTEGRVAACPPAGEAGPVGPARSIRSELTLHDAIQSRPDPNPRASAGAAPHLPRTNRLFRGARRPFEPRA